MKTVIKWLGLGFGSGLSPKAPGTVGSLVAVGLAAVFDFLHNPYFLLISMVAGILICEISERELGKKDDGRIVFDEFVGQWIAVAGYGGLDLVLGFILFRVFDIIKPPPIRQLQSLHGGIGIMIDDVLAGAMAWIVLYILKLVI